MRLRSGLLAAAIRVLPRRFRDRFGADLAHLIGALARDARLHGGRRAQLAYLARELWALARLAADSRRLPHTPAITAPNSSGRTVGFEAVAGDVRWAVRHARRRPLFAFAVTGTLALSITAATTAYGLATAVLWRPLPFRDAARVVFVWEKVERDGQLKPTRVTGGRYAAWRDRSNAFTSMALFAAGGFAIDEPGGVVSVRGVRVSATYFDTLGATPALGRSFMPADETPGQHQVVILSHALAATIRWKGRRAWQNRAAQRAALHDHRRHAACGLSGLACQSRDRHHRCRGAAALDADPANGGARAQHTLACIRRRRAARARRLDDRGR